MSASVPDPRQSAGQSRSISETTPAPSAPPRDPSLLERVIAETSEALVLEEPLTDAQRTAFENVACRHRGQPLTLEPVAAELVLAVLENHFSNLPGFARIGLALSTRIAQTLMEDPASCQRLECLWARLGASVP